VTVKSAAKSAPAAKAPAAKAAKPAAAKAAPEKISKRDTAKTKIEALWAKGKSRGQIAEALGITYASVFYHTKTLEPNASTVTSLSRGRIIVATEYDENGEKLAKGVKKEEVSRSEAMRRLYLAGWSIGDIGRHFDVRYQLAYTACKSLFGEAEADEE